MSSLSDGMTTLAVQKRLPFSVPQRAALLAVLAFGLLAGAIPSGHLLADAGPILQNPVVNGDVPLWQAFTRDSFGRQPSVTGLYRPLVVLSYWITRGSPWLAHTVNVLLHALVIVLAYLVGRRLFSERAALLGAVFASAFAAPAEAIQGLLGRSELMLAACVLGGLWAHRLATTRGAALAVLLLGAGLLSHEVAVVAPVAWLLFDALRPTGTPWRRRWMRFLGYGAVLAAYAGARAATGIGWPRGTALESPLQAASTLPRLFGAGRIFTERYLLGMANPFRRLYVCSAPACGASNAHDSVAWVGLGLLILGVLAVALFRRRAVAAGLAWFLVFFIPVSNILFGVPTSYAERLLYVPALGLAWALGVLIDALLERGVLGWLAGGAFAVLVLVNATALQLRNLEWHSEEALALSALKYAPDSAVVQANLAYAQLQRRQTIEAEEHARKALQLWTPYPFVTGLLADIVDHEGDSETAERAFRVALRQSGRDPQVVAEYARFLARHHRWPEAMTMLETDIRRDPLNAAQRALLDEIRTEAHALP